MAKTQLQELFDGAQRRFVSGGDSCSVFKDLLNHVLMVAGADYGFVGEIRAGDAQEPQLRVLASASTRWNQEANTVCHGDSTHSKEFPEVAVSLLGVELMDGCPLIYDDPGQDLHKAGLVPRRASPLSSFLALPIVRANTTVGILGIANFPLERAEALISDLQPVLSYCCTLVDAYRLEEDATRNSCSG